MEEDQPVRHGELIHLSGLSIEEIPQFETAWISLDPSRRLSILSKLAELADEVAVMYAGHVVEQAATKPLFHRPAHPYPWGLLRALPRQVPLEAAHAS